jgi:hypothetical protein
VKVYNCDSRMKTKKTNITEITVERSETFVVRKFSQSIFTWCGQCSADVRMCTPEEAAVLTHVSTRMIYQWIESDRLHFRETPEGLLLVCLNSVL